MVASQQVSPPSSGATILQFLKLQKSSNKETMVGQFAAKLKLKSLFYLKTIINHQKMGWGEGAFLNYKKGVQVWHRDGSFKRDGG